MLSGELQEIALAACGLLPVCLGMQCAQSTRERRAHRMLCALTAVYLFALFSVTGLPTVTDFHPHVHLSLVPFADGISPLTIANVLLFLPLGLAAPLLYESMRPAWATAAAGFSLSLFVEIAQMGAGRVSDVEDLLANTAGALLGWGIAALLRRYVPAARRFSGGGEACVCEAMFLAVVSFLYYAVAWPLIGLALGCLR